MFYNPLTIRWNKKYYTLVCEHRRFGGTIICTYTGKVMDTYFHIIWDREKYTAQITYSDNIKKLTSVYFESTLIDHVRSAMADIAGLSQHERFKRNILTDAIRHPTKFTVCGITVEVVRYSDDSRWWYSVLSDTFDWDSKAFQSSVTPSKEHFLAQILKGNFEYSEKGI